MRHPWRLVIALAIIVALLVVVDRVGASMASSRIADRVGKAEAVTGKPDVTIHGFPFLTQAIGGTYNDIEVTMGDLRASGGQERAAAIETVTTHLHGVHIPLGDAFSGDVHEVKIDRAEARAVVTYQALNQALSGTGVTVSQSASGSSLVDVSIAIKVRGVDVRATATCEVTASDGGITLSPSAVQIDGGHNAAITRVVTDALRVTVRLPPLPFRAEVVGVEPGAEGITLRAAVENVVVRD